MCLKESTAVMIPAAVVSLEHHSAFREGQHFRHAKHSRKPRMRETDNNSKGIKLACTRLQFKSNKECT